jgi:hypothetical protein
MGGQPAGKEVLMGAEEEEVESFEVSPTKKPERRVTVAEKKFLHITIIDHNPIIEGTGEASHIDLRIPLAMAEAGLRMIPQGKLSNIDPALVVQAIEMGAEGEIARIDEEKKSIHIRVE